MQQIAFLQTNNDINPVKKNNLYYKDEGLNNLAEIANVAQFVSFDANLKHRFSRIKDFNSNHLFKSIEEAVKTLLSKSTEQSVNVRSYRPDSPESNPFIKDLRDVSTVIKVLTELSNNGLYTIVNEKIDEKDGGVSGVVLGDIIEFAPDVVPRGVDDPNTSTVTLPRKTGIKLLETVYGFVPDLDYPSNNRVEFSVHPIRKGYRNTHTTVWEIRNIGESYSTVNIHWPNDFSRKLGDKAFGLLMAYLHNLPVPKTTVFSRFIAPFSFGSSTGTDENWIRTCPIEPIPGLYTTKFGWIDPFLLMQKEDPDAKSIASIISQEGVDAVYSGALLTSPDESVIIEGSKGKGDSFMVGESSITDLPKEIVKAVNQLYKKVYKHFGSVRMEWVYDGKQVWIVQLHIGISSTIGNTIYPGEPDHFHNFNVLEGLEKLRELISKVENKNEGIILVGNIGLSSHFGDVLRRAKIPSRIEKNSM